MSFRWLGETPDGLLNDELGVGVELKHEFETQADAEEWLRESWHELHGAGVTAVILLDGDAPCYSMPLDE